MKKKIFICLLVIIIGISCGFIYNHFNINNIEEYNGLPVYRMISSKLYDTSTVEGAIKYSDYAFIARVIDINRTEYKYDDNLPYTIYNIKVEKNINGELDINNNIEIIQYGGLNYNKKSYSFYENESYLKNDHYYFFSVGTWNMVEGEGISIDRYIDLGDSLDNDEIDIYSISVIKDPNYKKIISKYDINYIK